ncbi:MAG TPA: hypothetical protein VFR24_05290 [Candidatus Angelobacter sp.]|nr:hypothetical protein [Candidatus Angelobacter sp.]
MLLDFSSQHAIVERTGQQTTKRKDMFLITRPIVATQNRLHLIEHVEANDERVRALVTFAHPLKEPGIKGILKQLMEVALLKCSAGFNADDLPQFR